MTGLKIEGVVFDVDGVLFDTERLTQQTWLAVSREMGWPQVGEAYLEFVGQNRADIFQKMEDLFGAEFPKDAFMAACSARSQARMETEGVPMKPGVGEVLELLRIVGLEDVKDELATSLPYGKQRRLEIARALATQPKLLLLDEPAAGMNPQETIELTEFIAQIRKDFHMTILLIEHHMDLVMDISDRIYVLDFGELIAQGVPAEIQANDRVIDAYLGVADDAEN